MRTYGRIIGLAAAAVMVAGSGVAAHAGDASKPKLKVRKVTLQYTGGCGVFVDIEGAGASGAPGSCALGANYSLARKTGEKYLTILVKDANTASVSGDLWLKGGAGTAVNAPFCGSLKNYAMAQPTYSMDLNSAASTSCPGVATTGTVVIEYSNLPLK